LLREGREEARKVSPKLLEGGKIQQILVSNELAAKGIHNVMEIFTRDPINQSLAYIVVVEGSPKSLLERAASFTNKPIPAIYINQLLTNNKNLSNINDATVSYFNICYYAPGLDPMFPIIRAEEKDVKIAGTALFSKDKMVGRISTQQTTLLIALSNKLKKAGYLFPSPTSIEKQTNTKEGIVTMIKGAKSKINISMEGKQAVADISVKLRINLEEYQWDNMSNRNYQKSIEKFMSDQISNDVLSTIKYAQSVGSDPLGIGDKIRAKYSPYFKDSNWDEIYKNTKINVDSQVEIDQFGIIR
ncbi:MAG: Ger(x)C family spore germination protein, partial [Bacillota bacterium]|nr:Ger(x)C family spore germination protein [Bacillota bacterium]